MAGSVDELEFVLNCLRLHFGSVAAEVALGQDIKHKPDWRRIVSIAKRNGVTPLVRQSLLKLDRKPIPDSFYLQIQNEFQSCAINSLRYARELSDIQRAFHGAGLRALALKGPALAVRLYGKQSLRQCRDLDLLVARGDVARTIDVLSSLGYGVDQHGPTVNLLLKTDKHLVLVHRERGTRVEVHWKIALPSLHVNLSFDSLWDNRDAVSVLGTRINIPFTNHLLLMLCVHWASHCWASLKWGCDIAAFVRIHPDLDWTGLCRDAQRLGCLRMLLLAMVLARDATGVALPDPVTRKLEADPVIPRLSRDVRRRSYTTDGLLYEQRLMLYFRSRERVVDKVRFCVGYFRSLVAVRTRLRRIASGPLYGPPVLTSFVTRLLSEMAPAGADRS